MNLDLIGIDFSINKPAVCILDKNSNYSFYIYPYDIPQNIIEVYKESGINVISRNDNKYKGENLSEKIRYQIKNSISLSQVIVASLKPYLNMYTYLAFEGPSYASKGNVVIDLNIYKHELIRNLLNYISLENIYTYAPITLKSTAKCSQKGKTKADMIEKFIELGPECQFRNYLINNKNFFQTKKSKKWIIYLDDLIDSYWALKTLINNNEEISLSRAIECNSTKA